MYVCLCNAVTEKDIRALVAAGVRDFAEVQARTHCANTCGCCLEHALATFAGALGEGRPQRVLQLQVADCAA